MNSQHLSDEAVAAFADGCLRGHARERAMRHTGECAECAQAVQVQRDAAWALRAAPAPSLPSGLADRLRGLADSTPIAGLPTSVDSDGCAMFSTLGPTVALIPTARLTPTVGLSPTAIFAPPAQAERRPAHRSHPFAITTAAVVALAGVVAGGAAVGDRGGWLEPERATTVRQVAPAQPDVTPTVTSVNLLRAIGR